MVVLSMENIMCPRQDDAEELQDVGATPVFLNKLAACYFAKCLCVSEMRK